MSKKRIVKLQFLILHILANHFKFDQIKFLRNDQKNGMPKPKMKLVDLSLSEVDGLTTILEFISLLKHIPFIMHSDI